jgi:hypothetical protein
VSRLLNASDFDWIALAACFNDGLSYFWGANPAIAITPVGTSGDFTGGTSSQLQALLNSTPAGGRVRLNQKAVVFCDTPITIPPGVRLETYAIRRPKDYASMARLVRVANFDAPLVKVRPGAQLVGVWVDGQVRAQMPNGVVIQPTLGDTRANIWVDGRQDPIGRTSKVLGCRSSNSAGGTHLALRGSSDSPAERCGINTAASLSAGLGAVVKQNLITGYANRHSGSQWSDGISAKCENAHIAANQIIDATDGGIILFSLNNGN